MPLSGVLAANYGYESVFYVFGAIGCIWLVLWLLIVRESPEKDRFISEEEKNYILGTLGKLENENQVKKSPPWKAMFTSAAVSKT